MRIVGNKNLDSQQARSTPQEAWQRGRVLDAMLPHTALVPHGVSRLTHSQRNAQDDARMLAVARLLNTSSTAHAAT